MIDAPDICRNSALGLCKGELGLGNRDNLPNTFEEENQFDNAKFDMDDLDHRVMLGGSDFKLKISPSDLTWTRMLKTS